MFLLGGVLDYLLGPVLVCYFECLARTHGDLLAQVICLHTCCDAC